ncbi:MAG: 3,4-dihydroxy-2-butanone-4-phosphate synthase [Candidatus Hadarchaeota archaeon]|nr:3,4-dihydroxy-2-butanone-4-phosphate synthase [Candidatus Hadarchaeota archaeon]
MNIQRALEALRAGNFVLVHDAADREDETDLVMAAEKVQPHHVARLRQDAGGLICVALHPHVADNLGLPYMTEVYESAASSYEVLEATRPDDIPYDERSAFSISVNHRRTYTGVTDTDRALTISELGKLGARAFDGSAIEEFGHNFRSPGHVPLLRAARGMLAERQGHTELVVALAEMVGLAPVAAICEVLDAESCCALSREGAKKYASKDGLVYLEASDIVRAYGDREVLGGTGVFHGTGEFHPSR